MSVYEYDIHPLPLFTSDGDAPQNRKRKANSQMQKLGATPPPPTAPCNGGSVGSTQLPTASVANGLYAAPSSIADHVTTKDAAPVTSASVPAFQNDDAALNAMQDAKGTTAMYNIIF